MLVRLTRKLAECIDGIDLSTRRVGQMIELPHPQAALLIAEGWAVPAAREFSRARNRHDADANCNASKSDRHRRASSQRH